MQNYFLAACPMGGARNVQQPKGCGPCTPLKKIGVLFAIVLCASAFCRAQSGTSRVGVIDLKLIITNMQETIDARRDAAEMQAKLTALISNDQTALKDLQDKLAKVPDHQSPAYQQLLDELDQKSLTFVREQQAQQITLARFQNRRLKQAFDEISALVAEQAKLKGLELVLLDNRNELPESHAGIPTPEAMANSFFNRTVAYKSDPIDFTNDVIAQLNRSYKSPASATTPPLPMTTMLIGTKPYQLEIAGDDASREHGLMERDTLPPDHGMIFVFDHASNQSFWMHHTRFPLDIIFADDHGKVVSVHAMKAYDEHTTYSDGPARYAIELPSGAAAATGVKAGDDLHIPPAVDAALKK